MQSINLSSTAPAHVQQLQTALLRRKEVEKLTALSRSRIYALMAAGSFPKPARLGTMSVAWVEAEVREWIDARIAERVGVQIMETTQKNTAPGRAAETTRAYSTQNQWNSKSNFDRTKLPRPADYFAQQSLKLTGGGEWRNVVCPFHDDTKPSLRIRPDTGSFRCMVCGVHGGDVLAFHQQRYGLSFKQAAQQLGAWRDAK